MYFDKSSDICKILKKKKHYTIKIIKVVCLGAYCINENKTNLMG